MLDGNRTFSIRTRGVQETDVGNRWSVCRWGVGTWVVLEEGIELDTAGVAVGL